MILTIPIDALPKRYPIPENFRNLHYFILLVALLVVFIFFIENNKFDLKIDKRLKIYIICCLVWPLICTIHGSLNYPYWDAELEDFLRNTNLAQKIAVVFPNIIQNDYFIHLKYAVTLIRVIIRDTFIPLFGIPLLFYTIFRYKSKSEILDFISKAALIFAIALSFYSAIEIPWLLTGNTFFADLLKVINSSLYDPTSNSWWPPILWANQLRSYTYEPSFFGIISMYIIPMLWYRAFELHENKTRILLVFFTWMMYLTRSRTAQVIYLGEVFLLIIFSSYGKYKGWLQYIIKIMATTLFAFAIFLLVPIIINSTLYKDRSENISINTLASQYLKNDVSSIGIKNTRSNIARWGNMIATFKVGLEHPFFGVGFGLQHKYISKNIPEFALNDDEINFWKNNLERRNFIEAGFPNLNSYSVAFACYGIVGLILYILPSLYLIAKIYIYRKNIFHDFGQICIIISFCGQIACLLCNHFMYTFPISLATMIIILRNSENEFN